MFKDYGIWTTWEGECDVTCGYGHVYKTRKCVYDPDHPPRYGCPVYCDGPEEDTQPCDKGCCHCEY